jgi:hypothetical protein
MRIPTNDIAWTPLIQLAFVETHGAAGSDSAFLIRVASPRDNRTAPAQLTTYPVVTTANSANV